MHCHRARQAPAEKRVHFLNIVAKRVAFKCVVAKLCSFLLRRTANFVAKTGGHDTPNTLSFGMILFLAEATHRRVAAPNV
jgi:hypothetical protein